MSFLFVDRIIESDPGRRVTGVKHVTANDTYLTVNQDQQAVLMPAIIGETLGQLGAWCVMQANQFSLRPVAGVTNGVSIQGDARVGDSIYLETIIEQWDSQAVQYHSVAKVNEQTIFSIENALGPMLPMEDFIEAATVQQQFANIYRPGSWQPLAVSDETRQNATASVNPITQFDHILAWQPQQSAVAVKHISLSAPYFADHFPKKPVLPLTILLQCKTQLAYQWLAESFPEQQYQLQGFGKIKMNEFVQPGDSLQCELSLKKHHQQSISLLFRSEVAGKRVCIAEAIFSQRNSS